MRLWQRNLLLLVLVVLLAAVPLVFLRGAAWKGADDRSMAAIQDIQQGYQPWVGHVFDPSALGIERYMFGLQALIGAAVTAGAIGWFAGRRRALSGGESGADMKLAGVIAVVAVVVLLALFIPQPESGEIQDMISAIQGICLGFFAYFAGYPLGRKHGAAASQRPAGGAL